MDKILLKICTKCLGAKPEEKFWLSKKFKRRVAACTTCSSKDKKRWAEKNATKRKELHSL